MITTEAECQAAVGEMNRLLRLVQAYKARHPNSRLGYQMTLGGILNAYREGDLLFNDAIDKLNVIANPTIDELGGRTNEEAER